jgi:DNA-binding transcriptional LysR family regulator
MEIRQITYFLALCEELHFTRAARRCGVAQPSLTNAIRLLEQEFGAPLFHRKPRPRLTALGAAVRPELARVLAHVDNALAHARRAPPPRRRSARTVRGAELPRAELTTRV